MAIEAGTFDIMVPSRYISFTIPNLLLPDFSSYLHTDRLRVAVLDCPSPILDGSRPLVAAMLVPKGRDSDWIFDTEAGQLQLLLSVSGLSRLILIGNDPESVDGGCVAKGYQRWVDDDPSYVEKLERSLSPLLIVLLPKVNVELGVSEVPFLRYEDNVISSVVLERCNGSWVGEMVVEDVEIEGQEREFRRRLRFKRMPNLVQSEILIVHHGSDLACMQIGEMEFHPELGVLVHPYLAPMVAGISLIGGHLHEKFRSGIRPRALCLGVGGGALLTFLRNQCCLEVVGVEMDEVVLSVARRYFGLESSNLVPIWVGDAVEILKKIAFHASEPKSRSMVACEVISESSMDGFATSSYGFDVILVDLDSYDCTTGINAPPLEFMQKDVLVAAKLSLSKLGILVLNVMLPNRSFYENFLHELREVFEELYEIDSGNGENFVVIATRSSVAPASGNYENPFVEKLKLGTSGAFVDLIRKI
ncbi:hypothetical protein Dimus_011564 [Dionaea muscipula]